MGREIAKIAVSRGHEVILRVDHDNAANITAADLAKGDVAIEFSTPATVVANIEKCFDAGLPVVVGTTGWYGEFARIASLCRQKDAALFYATNFSVGVNLFFKINTFVAELMSRYGDYDVSMEEIHHIHKLDKPSGTAITLAEQILQKIGRKKKWSIGERGEEILHIQDRREGEVPGTHIVKYQSAIDDIEIMHKAHNRQGFATGAVLAAEFLKNRKGLFTMSDLI